MNREATRLSTQCAAVRIHELDKIDPPQGQVVAIVGQRYCPAPWASHCCFSTNNLGDGGDRRRTPAGCCRTARVGHLVRRWYCEKDQEYGKVCCHRLKAVFVFEDVLVVYHRETNSFAVTRLRASPARIFLFFLFAEMKGRRVNTDISSGISLETGKKQKQSVSSRALAQL